MEQLAQPGMSPKSGILLSVLLCCFFINADDHVWPSGVTTTVLADSMAMAGTGDGSPLVVVPIAWPRAGSTEEICGARIISTMPSQ